MDRRAPRAWPGCAIRSCRLTASTAHRPARHAASSGVERSVARVAFLTSADEFANGVPSTSVAPSGAATADDDLKEEETE